MTKRKTWRYRCDFCRKSGCNGSHIRTHEKHCTHNPDRECRLCAETRDYRKLVEEFKSKDLDWLRGQVSNCPVCILSVIVQAADPKDSETRYFDEFNYKEELAEWWLERNPL